MSNKPNCIIFNKPFISNLFNGDNDIIPHEIIDFIRADDGRIYIYNNPYGANVKDASKYNIKYLFLTSELNNGKFYLEYCIEINKSLHYMTRGKKCDGKVKENIIQCKEDLKNRSVDLGIDYNEVKYDGIHIDALFSDSDKVYPFTFLAKSIFKAKPPICIDQTDNFDYNYQRNYGYILDNENPNAYDKIINISPENDIAVWEDITNSIEKFNSSKFDEKDIRFECINNNTFLDLINNYKQEECYTNILFNLFKQYPKFLKDILDSKNIKIDSDFNKIEREYYISNYGRVDLYFETNDSIIIFENKIESNITLTNNTTQLNNYSDWLKKQNVYNKYLFVLVPNYRKDSMKSEIEYYKNKEHFDHKLLTYSDVSTIYEQWYNNKLFTNFNYKENYLEDILLLLKMMSLERKELYSNVFSNRIKKIKSI